MTFDSRYILICAAVSFSYSSDQALADICIEGLEPEQIAFLSVIAETTDEMLEDFVVSIEDFTSANHQNFCALYESARFYLRIGSLERSEVLLELSLLVADEEDLGKFSPENMLGFIEIERENFDRAVEYFENARRRPEFLQLPQDSRMKILNNIGYTYLRLGRFEDAREPLQAAIDLGSEGANRNMEALISLQTIAQSSPIDSPGVFAAIVGSFETRSAAVEHIELLSRSSIYTVDELDLFRARNGKYAVSIGSYRSYLLAQQDLESAITAGIKDAFVTSLTGWEPVSPIDF